MVICAQYCRKKLKWIYFHEYIMYTSCSLEPRRVDERNRNSFLFIFFFFKFTVNICAILTTSTLAFVKQNWKTHRRIVPRDYDFDTTNTYSVSLLSTFIVHWVYWTLSKGWISRRAKIFKWLIRIEQNNRKVIKKFDFQLKCLFHVCLFD